MTRQYLRWTSTVDENLRDWVAQGLTTDVIAERLHRSTTSIHGRKSKLGLSRRTDLCLWCTGPLENKPKGRPRVYCCKDCLDCARKEQRDREVRARLSARIDWTCEGPGCANPLPRDNILRRYCSQLCRGRGHEATYQRAPRKPKKATS